MSPKLYELKNELKVKAASLHDLKKKTKETQRAGNIWDASGLQAKHASDKLDYRINHIAYSLLRGRKYEEIERTVREPLPDYWWKKIGEIRGAYEDVCAYSD